MAVRGAGHWRAASMVLVLILLTGCGKARGAAEGLMNPGGRSEGGRLVGRLMQEVRDTSLGRLEREGRNQPWDDNSDVPARFWDSSLASLDVSEGNGNVPKNLKLEAGRVRLEKTSRILEGTSPLPEYYDPRERGTISPVKDQGELGTCWAFSSLLALENALLPEESWDFSEDHMSHNPDFILGQANGGEYTMSMAYLLSWNGPVTEEQDPYGDGVSPEGLKAVKHVQEIRILPEGDREQIKRGVMAWGGVQSSLYTTMQNGQSQSEYYDQEKKAYCYPKRREPNHDVVIVGWDDHFPREAFRTKVRGDGAFLCENSWGTGFGDQGFFYVSYYDGNLGRTNVVYTNVEDPDNYDVVYQSDLCGWIGQLGYGEDTAWAANVYTAGQREKVEAVGFYATEADTEYQVYVLHNVPKQPGSQLRDRGEVLAEGVLPHAGYYTVPLKKTENLRPGERFAAIIRLKTPGTIHPIPIEYDAGDGKCRIDLTDGEGYISLEGKYWERAEEKQNCNICLKVYTSFR